jgi:SlyX protein
MPRRRRLHRKTNYGRTGLKFRMTDARISHLEERLAWFERHVVEQDRAILRQGEEIKALREALISLRERSASREVPLDPNEKPPHY